MTAYAGSIKIWNGSSWVVRPVNIKDVTAFNKRPVRAYYNGQWNLIQSWVDPAAGPSLLTNILSYWKLDDTSGTSAIDAKGLHDGSATTSTMGAAGKIGTCYQFAGVEGTGVLMPATTDYNLTSVGSISLWFTNSVGAWARGHLIGNKGVYESAGYGILVQSGATPFLEVGVGNASTGVFFSGPTLATDGTTWYHVVMTWDATGDLILYVNGTEYDRKTIGITLTNPASYNLQIGENPDPFNAVIHSGKIDEVGIWSRVLTSTEVTSLYNGGSGKSFDTF
jgi:hypothetical protein